MQLRETQQKILANLVTDLHLRYVGLII